MPTSILFSSVHRQNLFRVSVLRSFYLISLLLTIIFNNSLSSEDLYLPGVLYTLITLLLVNIFTYFTLLNADSISENTLLIHLLVDVVGVFFLLYFFGGYANPFIFYLLVPITIAAASLSASKVLVVFIGSVFAYSLLMTPFFFHDTGTSAPHHGENSEFGSHLVGMWASFMFSAVLLSVFLQAMSRTLQKKEQEINQQKEVLSRNEQVVALGTLAADAAHELSTPLSTMAITIKELQYECDGQSEICDDLKLLRAQVDRCKNVLTSLTERTGFSRPDSLEPSSLVDFIEQQLHEIQLTHPSRDVQYSSRLDTDLIVQNKPAFLHSLKNIIANAVEASEHLVTVHLDLVGENLSLRVANDGSDITHLNEKEIGTPFYTEKEHGLGLGLFLAISTIEQLGGGVEWRSRPGGGTIVQLHVPLDGLQAPSLTEEKQ